MLQQDRPDDYVIASGETRRVREFVEAAFAHIGKNIVWEGEGLQEVGKEADTGIVRVKVSPKYFRPTEVVSIFHMENKGLLYDFFCCFIVGYFARGRVKGATEI